MDQMRCTASEMRVDNHTHRQTVKLTDESEEEGCKSGSGLTDSSP